MAGIKFDQLDPETRKRVLKAMEEAGETGPERGTRAAEPEPETRPIKAGPPARQAGAAGEGDNGVAVLKERIGPSTRRSPGKRFIDHPLVLAWLFGLLLSGCWLVLTVGVLDRFLGSRFYENSYAVLAIPVSLLVLTWVVFWRKILAPMGLKSSSVVFSFVLMATAFCIGLPFILPTVIILYLYWRFRQYRPVLTGHRDLKAKTF